MKTAVTVLALAAGALLSSRAMAFQIKDGGISAQEREDMLRQRSKDPA